MSFSWQYPIYLIRHRGGYASIVAEPDSALPDCSVAVFTTRDAAGTFMETVGIYGRLVAIESAMEFSRLVGALKRPATSIAFDPASSGTNPNARWTVDAATLLRDHLPSVQAGWAFPVFVIRRDGGYASIEGSAVGRGTLVAIAVFTTRAAAEKYAEDSGESGEIRPLDDVGSFTALAEKIRPQAAAVAVDPTVSQGNRIAPLCVGLDTLIEKYLDGDSAEESN